MRHLLVILPFRFVEETLDALLTAALKLEVKLSLLSKTSLAVAKHQQIESIVHIADEKRTLKNQDKLLAQIDRLFEERPFSAVLNYAEAHVALAAKLTERYNLKGNSMTTALLTRDKYAMRKLLASENICVPLFEKVSSFSAYKKAVAKVGFPCISKPIDGAASNGVLKITQETNLQQAYDYATEGNTLGSNAILVESYIEGEEISVEGIVSKGKLTILGITAKTTEAEPFFNELMHIHPAPLAKATEQAIHQLTHATVKALSIYAGGIHLEAKISPEGRLYVIECASRLGGDNIPQLLTLSKGYAPHEYMLRSGLGLPLKLPAPETKTAGILFIQSPQEGIVTELSFRTPPPMGTSQKRLCRVGEQVGRPPSYDNSRLACILTQGDSYTAVCKALWAAEKTLNYSIG